MQYRPPNANLDSCKSIVTGYNGWLHMADCVGHSIEALSFVVSQLRYADKLIVKIMKVYIEMNNLQLDLIRYSNKC